MKYIFSLLILLIAGCQSFGGPKGTPYSGLNGYQNGKGQVYLYRPYSFAMSMAIPSLEIDGQSAMSVRNSSYVVYDLDSGEHKFVLKRNSNWSAPKMEFIVDVKHGERQFYRLSTDVGSIFLIGSIGTSTINGYLGKVNEDFALSEMRRLLYTGSWPSSGPLTSSNR